MFPPFALSLSKGERVAALAFGLLNDMVHLLYILTAIPFSIRYLFAWGIDISPKWKMEAARTAEALPMVTAW